MSMNKFKTARFFVKFALGNFSANFFNVIENGAQSFLREIKVCQFVFG